MGLGYKPVGRKIGFTNRATWKENNVVHTGKGDNALGSPLSALNHLVSVVDQQEWAEPIHSGEVITTGTLTELPYIHPGETWRVELSDIDLPALELVLT